MNAPDREGRTFPYEMSEERIHAFQRLPAGEKLRWLEDLHEFIDLASAAGARQIREKFRRGEI